MHYVLSTDRKSTRLNSSHLVISYAVFCLKKKKITDDPALSMSPAPNGGRADPNSRAPAACPLLPSPLSPPTRLPRAPHAAPPLPGAPRPRPSPPVHPPSPLGGK